jgi:hypothetical protein
MHSVNVPRNLLAESQKAVINRSAKSKSHLEQLGELLLSFQEKLWGGGITYVRIKIPLYVKAKSNSSNSKSVPW